MTTLCIRIQADLDSQQVCEWLLLNTQCKVLKQGQQALCTIHEQLDLDDSTKVIILLAGDRVSTTRVTVAAEHLAHIKKVMPFLVEEQLAEELEDVHIAVAPNAGVGRNSVAIVSHQEMIMCLELLYGAGLQADMLLPEFTALPLGNEAVHVLIDGDRAIVQYEQHHGTVVEVENLKIYLDLYFAEQDSFSADSQGQTVAQLSQSKHQVFLILSEQDILAKQQLLSLEPELVDYDISSQIYTESVFQLQAISAVKVGNKGLNLLQGGYQLKAVKTSGFPWSKIAAAAALFVVAQMTMLLASGAWFSHKAETLETAAVEQYRQIFPNERRVVNPRRQFQSHLNRQQSATFSAEFLHLLQQVADAMPSNQIPIKSMRYDAYGDGLVIDLNAQSMDQLEAYTTALSNADITVELLSANQQDNFVSGRIKLETI